MKKETPRMSDIEHVLKVLDIDDDGKDIVTNKVGMKKMVHFCILPNLKKSLMDKGMVLGSATDIYVFQLWYKQEYLPNENRRPIQEALTEDVMLDYVITGNYEQHDKNEQLKIQPEPPLPDSSLEGRSFLATVELKNEEMDSKQQSQEDNKETENEKMSTILMEDMIGQNLIREECKKVPTTKAIVKEYDDETNRLLLEYITEAEEWVEPEYVGKHGLSNQKGWKWARNINKNPKKCLHLKKVFAGKKKKGPKFKFGIRSVREAYKLDQINGNMLWTNAIRNKSVSGDTVSGSSSSSCSGSCSSSFGWSRR